MNISYKRILIGVSLIVCSQAVPSFAYDRIICFTDSMGVLPNTSENFCAKLGGLRPESEVISRAVPGRTTIQALDDVDSVVKDACDPDLNCLTLILHGINDVREERNPAITAKRLRMIYRRAARGRRRDAILMTIPPACGHPYATEGLRPFGRDITHAILKMRGKVSIIDVRDFFVVDGFLNYTNDCLHFNALGADLVAGGIDSYLTNDEERP